ncbi:Hydrocephalus-inducing protein [Anthophora quadrimaculata]
MDGDKDDKIVICPKTFDIVQILQCLSRDLQYKKGDDEAELAGRPSEFIKQMSMTTEERTQYTQKWRNKLDLPFCARCEVCNFEVSPTVVIFQQFTPGNSLSVTVTVRNVTRVSRYLKACYEPNPFFTVEHCGNSYSMMVAPGLSNSYKVKFMPEVNTDYHYELKFATDSGEFSVPVIGIGARGILDFPDRIEVPSTAVKIPSLKTIFVRNVGDAPAVFTLYTDNPCFWIEPSKGRVEEEESLQFIMHFLSNKTGDYQGHLYLEYDTGEKFKIDLRSSAENCPIRIDRGSVRMEETYLGLSRSKVITIHNRSDYIVKYKWMLFESAEADNERKEHYRKLFQLVYEDEIAHCVDLVHYNVCTPDIHRLVYQRIYTDELESLTKETFQYNHISFMFAPEEAEIWPQSSTEVIVFFWAMEVGEVTSTAYLEVTGREERIPLSLYGIGRGPFLQLNVSSIDLVNIYLCSEHNYEIVVVNKGHIPGTIIYKPQPTDFGGMIDVTPERLHLQPDEHKSFNLSFSSNRKGDFVERVDFVVKESLEVLSLHIKGCIVCPTLHFNKESLDFGTTALGFSVRQDVYLHNLSLIPVAFTITVLNDGNQFPVTQEDFAKAHRKPSFPSYPKEFDITPVEGVVASQDRLKIKVIYTPNIVRVGRTKIQVDMWDSDSDPLTLPVRYHACVPTLSIVPPEIVIFCFINYPYLCTFTVVNDSNLDGYFYIIPQQVSEDTPVVCSLSVQQGLIRARQSKIITATIITRVLGAQKLILNMLTMGEPSPSVSCVILCSGEGPVIFAEPSFLNFDEVNVLVEKTMEFSVINDSPIPAQFSARLKKNNSPWSIDPESSELQPYECITITVKLYLRDIGKFKDHVVLSIINGKTIFVELKTTGTGCSIVFNPNIFPTFDWGLLFSHQKIERTVTLTNHGTRKHQIIWATEPEIRLLRGKMETTKVTKFKLNPLILDIFPEETKYVTCRLFWDVNECVTEDWYVFAQIENFGKRALIGTTSFKVTLTEPHILFSKRELTFRVDICPDGDKLQQTDELLVTNQSKLDLNVQLSIKSPFYLISTTKEHVQSMKIILIDGATTTIRVFFNFSDTDQDLYSKNYSGMLRFEYQEHPNQDKILCKGYVYYPNIIVDPRNFVINCELGSSAEKILTLTNNGPVSVVYKFLWIGESIEIERDTSKDHCPGCSTCKGKLDMNIERTLEIHEVSSRIATDEDICINDGQNGSGDGPLKSIPPPVNSPVSETQKANKVDIPNVEENTESNDCTVSRQEIRQLLLSIVGQYFKKDEDLLALEAIPSAPSKNNAIDDVLEIAPSEGTVPPYSVRHVHVGFHGFEKLRVQASVVCEILRGPTERIELLARADAIKYSIDTDIIDFGQQLFLECSRKSFNLRNLCTIAFEFKIKTTEAFGETIDRFGIHPLTVQPDNGFVDAQSLVEFHVDHLPTSLGPIVYQFQLEIGHLVPVIMKVVAYGAFPQVYPCIPTENLPQYHSIELEYSAVQSLTDDFILNKMECVPTEKRDDLSESGIEMLKDMKYVIIDSTSRCSTNIINYGPWSVDMRMKLVGKKDVLAKSGIVVHFKKHSKLPVGNSAILQVIWHPTRERFSEKSTEVQHTLYIEVVNGCTIPITIKGTVTYPYVTVNTKLLDFQDVVVGECLVLCVLVKNVGLVDCQWEVKLSNSVRKKQQEDFPFYVKYNKNYCSPGDSEVVRVYFKPQKTCYIEAKLKIKAKMSLETPIVSLTGRGIEKSLNIIEPVIQFLPTVPYTNIQEIVFTVENVCNYPVEFFWHHIDDSFQEEERITKALLHYYETKEIFLPPKKPGETIHWELTKFYNDLINEMAHSLAAAKSNEDGKLEGDDVQFDFKSQEREVRRKRLKSGMLKKRISRKRSGRVSQRSVARKSSVHGSSRRRKKDEITDDVSSSDSDQKNCPDFSILEEPLLESVPLPTTDPEELQQMLLCYIGTLHRTADFRIGMRDPVKEIFENIQGKSDSSNNLPDPSKPEKRVCVIFHGAPFTEYQETACRSARVLEIPILNIDKAITEIISLEGSECSIQLRQIVDEAYENCIEAFEVQKERQKARDARQAEETESQSTKRTTSPKEAKRSPKGRDRSPNEKFSRDSSKSRKTAKAPKSIETTETPDAEKKPIIQLRVGSDPLLELDRIPTNEKLEMLDPLSRYEYKIETILLLERILEPRALRESPTDKADKTSKRKQDTSLLQVNTELILEALKERHVYRSNMKTTQLLALFPFLLS